MLVNRLVPTISSADKQKVHVHSHVRAIDIGVITGNLPTRALRWKRSGSSSLGQSRVLRAKKKISRDPDLARRGGHARARATIEIFFSKVLSGGGLEEDRDCRT